MVLGFLPATARCSSEGEEKAGSWNNPGTGLSQMTMAKRERSSYGFVQSIYDGPWRSK